MFDCEVLNSHQDDCRFPSSPSTVNQGSTTCCCRSIRHRMAVRSVDPFRPRPGQVRALPAPRAERRRFQINLVAGMMSPGDELSEELLQQPSKRPRLEVANKKLSDLTELELGKAPLKRGKLFESSKRLVQVPDGPLLEVPWNVSRWRHFHEGFKYTLSFDLASGALERVKRKRLVYVHRSRD